MVTRVKATPPHSLTALSRAKGFVFIWKDLIAKRAIVRIDTINISLSQRLKRVRGWKPKNLLSPSFFNAAQIH